MPESVTLIGYLDQDNLGIGYLASMLLQRGYRPIILDYRLGPERIRESIFVNRPLVVGFSIIFQYYAADFRLLMQDLRQSGIRSHFTAGGHYPSLRCRELLTASPDLDSVVRFEGEHTFLELVIALAQGKEWRGIEGLAYVADGAVVENPLRPLEPDLDNFPIPVRAPVRPESVGHREATILAGRGCLYNCSFCSIRQFYSAPPGRLKRIRRPEMVADEMTLLNQELGCTIFHFQDDDFPGAARQGQAWAERFCEALHARGLTRKLLWRISCRADEVVPDRMKLMRDAGLFSVYLGIESGNEAGLALMNKHVSRDVNLAAVAGLERLGLTCDFGYMLFDPLSTWQTIRENLDFLDQICADGYTSVTACKMIPYAGTAIEEELRRSNRLKAFREYEDYDFLDPAVDDFYAWFAKAFTHWMQAPRGLLNLSRTARCQLDILARFSQLGGCEHSVRQNVTECVSSANRFFTGVMRDAVSLWETGAVPRPAEVDMLAQRVRDFEAALEPRLESAIAALGGEAGPPARRAAPIDPVVALRAG